MTLVIAKYGKELILMRGVSGSGKSTKAKELAKNGVILSTDDFFMNEGKYVFDPSLLGVYHKKNLFRTIEAMKKAITPIVVDNTNITASAMKPYVQAAIRYGYRVVVAEPDSPEWKDFRKGVNPEKVKQISEEFAKRNKHDVPKDVIEKMLSQFQHKLSLKDILDAPDDVKD